MDKAREIALKTIYNIEENNAYSNIELDNMIKQNKKSLTEKDISLISEIVYGVISRKITLDEIIKKYSKIKIKKISTWILNILRMGIYQIIFLDKIPKYAAVNECVNLAKRYGHKSSSNFVNAILNKVEKSDFDNLKKIENDIERISVTTSMPIWIVEELSKNNDIKQVEEICENLNLRPQLTIRINSLKISKQDFIEELNKQNIKYEETYLENFLCLKQIKNIENMELFKDGFFTIQDLSAGEAAITLNPKEGDSVLDACSSPGGKTTHLAEIMNNKGKIDAWDIHEHRVELVKNTAKRLGIEIINAKQNDATSFDKKLAKQYDKILLDVPCLGIGVIKRKPDIKWQRKKDDIDEITNIQLQILEVCSNYIKDEGEIVYSTCSIFYEEDRGIINKFLSNKTNFKIMDEKIILPNKIQDGFYICKLKKN